MSQQPDLNWRPVLRSRVLVAAGALVLWVLGIEARLFILQVREHDHLVSRAERQQMSTIVAPAKRGEIFDRNGRLLAYSVDADTIYAVPTDIPDAAQAATALCTALDDCTAKMRDELRERLSQQRSFVYVRRRATPMQAKRVAALGLPVSTSPASTPDCSRDTAEPINESSPSNSRLTQMRSAWKVRVAGSIRCHPRAATARRTISARRPVVSMRPSPRARTIARATCRDRRSSPN